MCNVSKGQQVCKKQRWTLLIEFRFSDIPIEYWIGEFKKLSDYRISDSEKTIGCPPLSKKRQAGSEIRPEMRKKRKEN
jgi:hypothetical protein